MLASKIFLLLAAPLVAFSMIVVTSTSYANCVATLGIRSYYDAPMAFAVNAVSADGTTTRLAQSVSTGTGVLEVALPSSLPAGRYTLQLTSVDGSHLFSKSKSITVSSADACGATASYTLSVTGTVTLPVTGTTTSSTFATVGQYPAINNSVTDDLATHSIMTTLPAASPAAVTGSIVTVASSFGFKSTVPASIRGFLAVIVAGNLFI